MRPYGLVLLLIATSAMAQSAGDRVPENRPRLTADQLRPPSKSPSGEVASDEISSTPGGVQSPSDVVAMAPFAVTSSALPAAVSHDRPQIQAPADHPFDWINGGTILSHVGSVFTVKLETEYNSECPGLNLLKISW